MKIKDLGEFGLIERIKRAVPVPGKDVLAGVGDDVAVLTGQGNHVWLATCDVQIEGAHFTRNSVSPHDLGRKAMAINMSDIAATGGIPRFALVSLGLPADLDVEFVDEMYEGLRRQAEEFDVEIVGGNLSESSHGIFIDVFLLGQALREHVVLRSGAREGDLIVVTGTLGDAAAGVAMVADPGLQTTDEYCAIARRRRDRPAPRVREGRLIGASGLARAMIDVSDGLGSDLAHLCDMSKVGARVWAGKLPVARENRDLALAAHRGEWDFALFGGEDYELAFTASPRHATELAERITRETGTSVTVIGEILSPEQGRTLVLPDNRIVPLEAGGWDHFKSPHGRGSE